MCVRMVIPVLPIARKWAFHSHPLHKLADFKGPTQPNVIRENRIWSCKICLCGPGHRLVTSGFMRTSKLQLGGLLSVPLNDPYNIQVVHLYSSSSFTLVLMLSIKLRKS